MLPLWQDGILLWGHMETVRAGTRQWTGHCCVAHNSLQSSRRPQHGTAITDRLRMRLKEKPAFRDLSTEDNLSQKYFFSHGKCENNQEKYLNNRLLHIKSTEYKHINSKSTFLEGIRRQFIKQHHVFFYHLVIRIIFTIHYLLIYLFITSALQTPKLASSLVCTFIRQRHQRRDCWRRREENGAEQGSR